MTPQERADRLVGKWAARWFKCVEDYERNVDAWNNEPYPNIPGITVRLNMAEDIAKVIQEALDEQEVEMRYGEKK